MMYQRYGNPEGYLNRMIPRKGLYQTVSAILWKEREDRLWSLYLAAVANPLGNPGSFREFEGRYGPSRGERVKENCLNRAQIEIQVDKASQLLREFVPREGRGKNGS